MTRWDIVDLLVGAILILGVAFVLSAGPARAAECGQASWYGERHHGRLMANGRPFNMGALTAAHKTMPLGTVLRVANPRNGRSVKVTITDRGPFIRGRDLDLSKAAAARLGMVQQGVGEVCWTVVR